MLAAASWLLTLLALMTGSSVLIWQGGIYLLIRIRIMLMVIIQND